MRYGTQGGGPRRNKSRSGQRGPGGQGGGGGGGGGGGRNRVYESNGPEGRVRGTAAQVMEKYETLGKDAASAGDHVLAESFYQHAEHYRRIAASFAPEEPRGGNRFDPEGAAVEEDEGEDEGQGQADSSEVGAHGLPASLFASRSAYPAASYT